MLPRCYHLLPLTTRAARPHFLLITSLCQGRAELTSRSWSAYIQIGLGSDDDWNLTSKVRAEVLARQGVRYCG
ncbi:hypothetical protein C8Q80DRAFT_1158432 [Daedaleopsis nitida]|nr:hypothetical protein C8Q80DRAFT_1158432 [Daedaleopsis nitida]